MFPKYPTLGRLPPRQAHNGIIMTMDSKEYFPKRIPRRELLKLGAEATMGMAIFSCGVYNSESQPEGTPTQAIDQSYHNLDDLDKVSSTPGLRKFEASLKPTEFVFDYKDTVPLEDRKLIEESAYTARDFYFKELGTYIRGVVKYSVDNDPQDEISGRGASNRISINVGSPQWPHHLRRRATVGHEQFHIMQEFLSNKPASSMGTFWLLEGAADYAGWMANVNNGLITYEEFIDQQLRNVRGANVKFPPINSVIDRRAYALATLAVDFLVEKKGLGALGDYYKLLSHNSWKPAFEFAFGETPDEFQNRFEAWRAKNNI